MVFRKTSVIYRKLRLQCSGSWHSCCYQRCKDERSDLSCPLHQCIYPVGLDVGKVFANTKLRGVIVIAVEHGLHSVNKIGIIGDLNDYIVVGTSLAVKMPDTDTVDFQKPSRGQSVPTRVLELILQSSPLLHLYRRQ